MKEFALLRVVGVFEVEGNRDVGFDGLDKGGWGGVASVAGGFRGDGVFAFVFGEAGKLVLMGGEGSLVLLEVFLESLDLIGGHGDQGGKSILPFKSEHFQN
jgi:hypothetical protein